MPTREKFLWGLIVTLFLFWGVHTYAIFKIYNVLYDIVDLMEQVVEIDEEEDR